MSSANKQEMAIIQAFSSVDVPERIIRESNIKELIIGMSADQDSVQSDARRLERLRKEKKEGNFIGNWWNDRDDEVQDAQIDLNKSIGRLTQKSSQLLIVNTAVSKILNDQQNILLNQQNILKQQTQTLEEQNHRILHQQNRLSEQQKEINAANQGLMEAKGLTQEQARKLVGCVVQVTQAEQKIETANEALRTLLNQQLQASVAQCTGTLKQGFAEQTERHSALEKQLSDSLLTQSQRTATELERFASNALDFRSLVEQQLQDAASQCIQTLNEGLTLQEESHHAFEAEINQILSKQTQQTAAELKQFASNASDFSTRVEQQMAAHILAMQNKTEAQDAETQQMRENLSAQSMTLQRDMMAIVEQKTLTLGETSTRLELKHDTAQLEQAEALATLQTLFESSLQQLTTDLSSKADDLGNAQARLQHLQDTQKKNNFRHRLALATIGCLSVASLCWQVARHYALI